MCCDILKTEKTLATLKRLNVELLHIDIMEGVFVPNITLGTDYIKRLREITDIPLDIHLMITSPEAKLDWFDVRPGDTVSVHSEATPHIHRALMQIKERGAAAVLALNPGTPITSVPLVSDVIDGVLIMTVNPGYAGQKLIEPTLPKITALRELLNSLGANHVFIETDGNVSFHNAALMRKAGADTFVAGTASIFSSDMPMDDALIKLRQAII